MVPNVILEPVNAFESEMNCGDTERESHTSHGGKGEKRDVPMDIPGHRWVFGAVTLWQGIQGSSG